MIRVDGINRIDFDFRRSRRPSAGTTSARTTSRRSCRRTTAGWSCSTTRSSCSPTPRTQPSTSASTCNRSAEGRRVREGRREVLHRRQPPALLGRESGELGAGAEEYAKGWIECFHAYQGLGPPRPTGRWRSSRSTRPTTSSSDVFAGRRRRPRGVPVDVPEGVVHEGLQHIEQNASLLDRFPGKLIVNGRLDPREGEAGLEQLRGGRREVPPAGRASSTRRSGTRARAAGRWRTRRRSRSSSKCQELGIKNIHVHKGPTIWPLDKDAFDVEGRRPRGDRASRSSTSSSSTSVCRGSRTSASWRRRSPTSTPVSRWSSAA